MYGIPWPVCHLREKGQDCTPPNGTPGLTGCLEHSTANQALRPLVDQDVGGHEENLSANACEDAERGERELPAREPIGAVVDRRCHAALRILQDSAIADGIVCEG